MSGSTGSTTASRRRGIRPVLTAGGALGIAAGMTIAGAALAAPAHAATGATLHYTCSAPAIGLTFTDRWTVSVDASYPATVAPGGAIAATKWSASVTAGDDAAVQLQALGINSWSGSVKLSYAAGGDVASPGDRSVTLSVPVTKLPADGAVSVDATGTAAAEQAGDTPGSATLTAGDLTAQLTTDAGVPIELDCSALKGQDATVATVEVGASPSSSTSATGSPTTSSTVTTGPPIITDGGADGGSNSAVLASVGIGVVGAGVLTAGARRRMRGRRG